MYKDRRDPHAEALRIVGHRLDTGVIAPGQSLVITEIAKELGISPTPVREALAWLCGAGRLRRSAHHGYEAFHPSANDLVELFELRRILLHGALGLINEGGRAVSLSSGAAKDEDSIAWTIVQASGNALLSETFACLSSRLSAVDRAYEEAHGQPETTEPAQFRAWVDRTHLNLVNRVVEISRDVDRLAREAGAGKTSSS